MKQISLMDDICNRNLVIQQSSLWKEIHENSRRNILSKLTHSESHIKCLVFSKRRSETIADWKAKFVEEYHRALIVLGSNLIREWKGHSAR